ncbi:glucose uptake protein [Weissella uvarum]|uniref:GRP family sugar transporter n=1 Tax=Weissella uvarum TaxID=1479233 RepID=UPI0019608E7F|nr:GRP family sugar transporter [Weissella uvarum]MBM7617975.1 glucose uptake protein [Weissella uvarum]MCM0596194.1 glucose transporter [Weissella uvarum]
MLMLVALIPALAWGSVGIVTTKMGGTAAQGTIGMTLGALIFGLATMLFYVIPAAGADYAFNPRIWLVGFVSGLFWAVGTAGQFVAFKKLGVSVGNPLSTASQIALNALMAASVLGEWTTGKMWLYGLIAIAAVVAGAIFTSLPDKNAKADVNPEHDPKGGLIAITISSLGFMMYFVFPNLLNKVGYISNSLHNAPDGSGLHYMTAIVGPQSIGQVIGALLIVIFVMHEGKTMWKPATFRNILTGLIWGIGNIAMFISAANPQIGQATATTLSQLGIIVGTFGGIYILHEKKTPYQMKYIILGTVLVVVGAVVIANLGSLAG